MTPMHEDLLAIVDAAEIISCFRYSVLGEIREVSGATRPEAATDVPPAPLISALADALYGRLYTRPSSRLTGPRADVLAERDLLAALSKANTGQGTWASGWTVTRRDEGGRVVVTKDDVEFWAWPNEVRASADQLQPQASCRVWVAKEWRHRIPGFYFAIGDGDSGESDDGEGSLETQLIRYYWHLKADAAVPFIAITTSILNDLKVPFEAKVLSDPQAFNRADAGVIYLRRQFLPRIDGALSRIYAAVAHGLRPEVPMFTKRLANGLGYAEDPAGSLSFGMHRCRIAALGLWNAFTNGENERAARANAVAAAFAEEKLCPLCPHLGPGASQGAECTIRELDSLTIEPVAANPGRTSAASIDQTGSTARLLFDAACRIGEELCRSAHWDLDGRLCNWMGRSTAECTEYDGPITPTSAACGADIYAGSSGIALFLSQLYAQTGDIRFRRTALGAAHRSVRQIGRSDSSGLASPLSFYSGHLGVAFATRFVGMKTGDGELCSRFEPILVQVLDAGSSPHSLDVIGGNAGAIPVLLRLAKSDGLERCYDRALALGDELCERANRRGSMCAWEQDAASDPETAPALLTGFSHGAAGMGLALTELHAATGRAEYLETARGAFAYEDSLFDRRMANWPDLRRSSQPVHYARTWCHGAPGIALARLRAAQLDPDNHATHSAAARVAIATTIAATEQNLETPRSDTSLCHGLAGLGEILLIAGEMLGEPSYQERAVALGRVLIDRYAKSGAWPSGAPSGGPNPSLMLGLAGIGYWLLRLHDPVNVPSILLFVP
jgi:lantibiotic biosynthesis protein